jgi:hypothetical protein
MVRKAPLGSVLFLFLLSAYLFLSFNHSNTKDSVTVSDAANQARVSENYGKLPLSFEVNQGQTDGEVKFISHGSGYKLFLTSTQAVLALKQKKSDAGSAVLRMQLLGANPTPLAAGLDQLPGRSNYFIGNDPKRWRTDIPLYGKVRYKDIYPGVDMIYYGNQRQLEYDLVVSPGASPKAIRLGFEGADKIEIDRNGELLLQMVGGEIRQHRPIVYQEVNGGRQIIAGNYVLKGKREVGFEVAAYDEGRPLVIDPVLSYSTYLGGSGNDTTDAIAVDAAGNAYIAGTTGSMNFPTANALQPNLAGGSNDVIVTKLNPTGSALVYSTYLGGSSGVDQAFGIAVDAEGNAYVTGPTRSNNFPLVNAFQATFHGNPSDAYLSKLNPTGNALIFSTYLGGNGNDEGKNVALDSSGNIYLTGITTSTDFPKLNPLQATLAGQFDLYVTKMNPEGSALIYSTYLGGSGTDGGSNVKIAVDSNGSAYVTGDTTSSNYPTTTGAFQIAKAGGFNDIFVSKLNAAGSGLDYSTYLGGSGDDAAVGGIAVDSAGNAYVAGNSSSSNFPVANALQPVKKGTLDIIVTKLNAAGSGLVYSTYLGGNNSNENASGIAIDSAGNVYVSGQTNSTDFPLVNPVQVAYGGGGSDAFAAKLNPAGSALLFSTYLGGSGTDGATLAIDSLGNIYLTGATDSTNLPTTPGSFQTVYGGAPGFPGDGFVAKIGEPSLSINDVIVTEGNGGTVNAVFTVTVSPAATQNVTVNFATSNGTATAGADYLASSGMLTIPAGQTTGTITVTVNGDLLDEPDETFSVNLSNPTNAIIVDGQGLGTIIDDDPPPSLSIDDTNVTEGNSGTEIAIFTVSLSAASGKTVTVNFSTAGGTATAGSDYNSTSDMLTFNPGETTKSINVTVIGNTIVEADETFFVNLASPVNATIGDGQGTGTIFNDDAITLSPATLPSGTIGIAYSQTITASDGTPPYSFTVTSGSLPTGLMLSTAGAISGTPSETGSFTFTVTAEDTNGFTGRRSYTILIDSPVQCESPVYSGPAMLTAGTTPRGITKGDFNEDNNLDLAVANFDSGVSVFLGNGMGGFSGPTNFTVGGKPSAITAGDFNGDGKIDLVVSNPDANNVSILLGNGAGSFTGPTNFGTGANPVFVAVGDFNEDGKPDLVTTNNHGASVSILLGNGSGGFAGPTNFSVQSNPISVVVRDLNQDGNLDLAVTNSGSGSVSILLGNGAGGFSGATNIAIGALPISIAAGDFNGDGKLDLSTANQSPDSVSILLGNGTGGFAAPTSFGAGFLPTVIAVGEFNGDGKLDLAVANNGVNDISSVSIFLGDGVGAFGAPIDYGTGGSAARAVSVGDFNEDGKFDLAIANSSGTVGILLNACCPEITLSPTTLPTGAVGAGYSQMITASGGADPYSFSVTGGSLPNGLSLSTGGLLSGTPNAAGNFTFTVTATDSNGCSGSQSYLIQIQKAETVTLISSDTNPSVSGQPVNFFVNVTTAGSGTPTGTVTIKDGTTTLSIKTLVDGLASFNTSSLSVGTHPITVEYSGDDNYNSSTSANLSQIVNKADTTTTIESSSNPSASGDPITFTATVSSTAPGEGTPTGTVAFKDGGITIGTASLDSSGVAEFTTSSLSAGSHAITAEYLGNGNFNPSTSETLSQTVLNTPVGTNVVVQPVSNTGTSPLTLNFSNITEAGDTNLLITSSGPPPPTGFRLGDPPTYFDITTTAVFEGSIGVCIDYTGITFENESALKLFHYENGEWVNRTISLDTTNHVICASVTSFSFFALFAENAAPTVNAGGPYSVNEGSSVSVTATGSDIDDNTLTYRWDLDNNGTFETVGQTVSFSAATLDGPSSHTIRVQVTDSLGLSATAVATVNVANVSPTVGALSLSTGSILENDTVELSGSFSDPGLPDTYTVRINWGDGSPDTVMAVGAGTTNFNTTHRYLDDNPTGTLFDISNITVTVTDDDTGMGSSETTVSVSNVAPIITGVTGPVPLSLGSAANVTLNFTDPGSLDSFTVTYSWDDGQTSTITGTTERTVTGTHTYTAAGVYTVQITVTDDDTGSASTSYEFVVIYDPDGGFVTGGGFIISPAGALESDPTLTGKANFGFNSKYQRGATVPTGNTEFQFKAGNFNFKSTSYDFLVVAGHKAQFKGSGKVNGTGDYSFILTVVDGDKPNGGGTDKFRIKILDKSTNRVVYDNKRGESDDIDNTDPQAIAGGSIVIHDDN